MKNMKLILLAITAVLLTATCKKEIDDQGNKVTYYKTIGEGYIVERDNNKPIEGVKIVVTSFTCIGCGGMLYFGKPGLSTEETFITDENGYYQIRFAKKVKGKKVEAYKVELNHFSALPPPTPPARWWSKNITCNNKPCLNDNKGYISLEEIRDKKTITFDTVTYYLVF